MDRKMVADNSYWIGYVDDRKVPFHRLILEKGTTYNSYFLDTEKPTIIDTVDISFGRSFVETLKEYIELERIQYIVINHVEPDHSGGLPALANKAKDAVIVTTELGAKELKEMYKLYNREFLIIKDEDTLDIGGKTLQFFETPYLHTEETMITYAVEDRALYSCDIFSTHIATEKLFNDLVKEDIIEDFKGYYSLIMHPHRPYVQDMIEKIRNIDIKTIAPSHGYILRDNPVKYIDIYDEMSKPKEDKKALILYSTMTGSTRKVANHISEELKEKNIETIVMNIKEDVDLGEVREKIKESDAIFFGSSTRYADMVGGIEKVLKMLKYMKLEEKIGVAFGSYGWSGEAIEIINDYLRNTDIKLVDSSYVIKFTGIDNLQFPLRVKFAPKKEKIEELKESARIVKDILVG
ncbi:FprA family A-type flavoprotein [Clostridium sp. D2Q-14]|uniref:FprA family A-type flavoprotein n=1 Tax=Anaeromonas gelatinilytica TaxID=2683194 RepID=UPI00193C3483|nr:FprA family A-type flavoprotein [Anaeromonas gelatinilytica]MBS4534863.1 FprA family A-type flavoprotein [Anaeromonas gelatinilytica]